MKRSKQKSHCPNPLFEQWLEEWKNEAAVRVSPMSYCFGKALASLRKYPLELKSGKDCYILQNFGKKLCLMLDKKLKEYKRLNPDIFDEPNDEKKMKPVSDESSEDESRKNDNKTPERPYIPKTGTAGHAILVTMYKKSLDPDYIGYMKKAELQREAQELCECSLNSSGPDSRYNGWSSMATLISKNLVTKSSSPAMYSLTDSGVALALSLYEVTVNRTVLNDSYVNFCEENAEPIIKVQKSLPKYLPSSILHSPLESAQTAVREVVILDEDEEPISQRFDSITIRRRTKEKKNTKTSSKSSDSQESPTETFQRILSSPENNLSSTAITSHEVPRSNASRKPTSIDPDEFYLMPNSFDIILLVDTCETAGGKTRPQDDATISELSRTGVLFEVKHLKIGDFTWIARCRYTNKELVLPYIVERKRMDDLSASIKDHRFYEQKYRLKKSGIKNVIYMVENYGKNQHLSLPLSSLYQASVNSLIQDNFTVKYTCSHRESMQYLALFTKSLINMFKNKELRSCKKENLVSDFNSFTLDALMEFEEFNKAASKAKNFTARDMFIRHLVQLKGISVDKAIAIAENYPTPRTLAEAFKKDDENLLASIVSGSSKRQIGPVISKTLYQLYTQRDLY